MKTFDSFENYIKYDLYPFNNKDCSIFQNYSKSCSKNKSKKVLKLLGPKGKVGIPYKYYKCNDPNAITIYKSSKMKRIILKKHIINQTKYCGLDEFTNESFIGYMIEDLIKEHKYITKSYVKQYGAYVCPNTSLVYNHMELCDLGDMSRKIDTSNLNLTQKKFCKNKMNIVSHALLQVSSIITFLQKNASYSHGDLKAGNVFIKNESTITKYGQHEIESPITFKIADYGKNCITVKNHRLYNYNIVSKFLINYNFMKNKNSIVLNKYKYVPNYYRSQLIYAHMRHIGSSIMGDIDIYIFVLSLILNPIYENTIKELPKQFHEIMWYPNQINLIDNHILKIKSKIKSNRLKSVTTPMIFLTTPLSNGEYIKIKKGNAKHIFKHMSKFIMKGI